MVVSVVRLWIDYVPFTYFFNVMSEANEIKEVNERRRSEQMKEKKQARVHEWTGPRWPRDPDNSLWFLVIEIPRASART